MFHHTVRKEGENGMNKYQLYYGCIRKFRILRLESHILSYMVECQGILTFLKSFWVGENKGAQIDTMSIHQYLNKLRGRLERTANQAKIPSEVQQGV